MAEIPALEKITFPSSPILNFFHRYHVVRAAVVETPLLLKKP
jgi:hypothetical protein